MKTIYEINQIAPYHPCEWQHGYGIWQHGFMEGQKSGAAEQRQIDIDKACEWLEMNIEYWLYDDGFLDVPTMIENFRKAMEEKK